MSRKKNRMGKAGIEPTVLCSNYVTGSPSDHCSSPPFCNQQEQVTAETLPMLLSAVDFKLTCPLGCLPAQQLRI